MGEVSVIALVDKNGVSPHSDPFTSGTPTSRLGSKVLSKSDKSCSQGKMLCIEDCDSLDMSADGQLSVSTSDSEPTGEGRAQAASSLEAD